VLPVNPDLVARRRGPAKKKDDAEDARICCLLALDQYAELRGLIHHSFHDQIAASGSHITPRWRSRHAQ